MIIDTERLKIRDITLSDEKPFIKMASDGSLNDVGFNRNCSSWMKDWILEAQVLAQKDNPRTDYLAYVIEDRKTGFPIGSVGCSFYADLEKVGITYFVGAEYRNKGYASEAAKAYVRYFFEHYDDLSLPTEYRLIPAKNAVAFQKVIGKSKKNRQKEAGNLRIRIHGNILFILIKRGNILMHSLLTAEFGI